MVERITNNADETSIQVLFESQCLFQVPYFQRPYKWSAKKVRAFSEDLSRLADSGLEDNHFVGAIIIHGQPAPPVAARPFQVIDGQQRLTTIYLFLLGFVRSHLELGDIETAKSLFTSYLVTSRDTGGKSNLKLHPSGADRASLNSVITEVLDFKNFRSSIAPLEIRNHEPGGASPSNRIESNFREIKKILKEELAQSQDKRARLEHLHTALLQLVTLVQIDIKDPLMGPVIFDRLNSGQQPMTVGELVKNDVLSRGTELTDIQRVSLENEVWQPFVQKFGAPDLHYFDTFLFPYGLIRLNSNIKKGDVYKDLREDWTFRKLTTKQIVGELEELQMVFLDLTDGKDRCNFGGELKQSINRLVRLRLPTMMFSYVMRMLNEARKDQSLVDEVEECVRFIESFIVRRGAFGLEPSGLHAAFKGLWTESDRMRDDAAKSGLKVPTLSKCFVDSIRERATVKWPNRKEFEESLRNRNLYGSKVTRYILTEYNRHLPGDHTDLTGIEIEHVLPQSMSAAWKTDFSSEQHTSVVDKIGNLTLLTEKMNNEVSNGGYASKRPAYKGSKYVMTRKLADDYPIWNSSSISNRAEGLISYALNRWPEE